MNNMKYVLTVLVTVFSLTNINTVITTLILLVTLMYWIQKNIGEFKEQRKNKTEKDADK